MSRVTHVLDTSALLAHYFNEPGADTVQAIWESRTNRPGISVISITELRGRLSQEIADVGAARSAADAYLNELTVCLPVDRATAEMAWQLRNASAHQLPLVDAVIAATARVAGAVLVHKDPHMAGISTDLVQQTVL
jgi:predicted nucleic acid-binding protein